MITELSEPDRVLLVHDRQQAADAVVTLELRDPSGRDLPSWSAGAHIDIVVGDGLVRQYSLCGDPEDLTTWRIAVLREPDSRGGSAAVHERVGIGEKVIVRGPRNHFPFVESPRYLFIAGGIGITPILPMLAAADRSGAEWTLLYGGRARASMAFADLLQHTYGDRVRLRPQDEHGLLDLASLLEKPAPDTLVYCCGPTPLIDAVERHCGAWPTGALRVERFRPKPTAQPVPSESFEVELADSGLRLTVPPDRSILQTVLAAGVQVLSSCEEGTCGTCETPVLEGLVDHRDSLLTDEERAAGDTMLICVSRAACPKLVLGL